MSLSRYAVIALALAAALGLSGAPARAAGEVTVTPLGSHDGEFCRRDRAILFEDPQGLRVLYDPGRTVMGPDDPRLGRVDVVLLSSVHPDHLGDRRGEATNRGTCARPELDVRTTDIPNTVAVAAAKGARVFVAGEMRDFLRARTRAAGGDPGKVDVLRPGGKRTVNGVTFAVIPVAHSNGLDPKFIGGALGEMMETAGVTAYLGPDSGFIIEFTSGLVAYLTGDTGITSDMELVVRRYYRPDLAVVHMGDVYTMGPEEAAYAVNDLIRPRSVIPTHANEAATENGILKPDSKTARFVRMVRGIRAHVPLSGRAMTFDRLGICVSGC